MIKIFNQSNKEIFSDHDCIQEIFCNSKNKFNYQGKLIQKDMKLKSRIFSNKNLPFIENDLLILHSITRVFVANDLFKSFVEKRPPREEKIFLHYTDYVKQKNLNEYDAKCLYISYFPILRMYLLKNIKISNKLKKIFNLN